MSDKTLSQRLRELKAAIQGGNNAHARKLVHDCIAQVEAQEAQAKDKPDAEIIAHVYPEREAQAIGEQTPVAKSEMWHADPWLIGNVEAWAKEPPTQAKEDDDDHMKQARAELARVMAANGWDIYGGSTYPWVVAMNYAWQEGWLDAFTCSPISSDARDKAIEALNVSRWVCKSLCREDHVDMIDDAIDALRG